MLYRVNFEFFNIYLRLRVDKSIVTDKYHIFCKFIVDLNNTMQKELRLRFQRFVSGVSNICNYLIQVIYVLQRTMREKIQLHYCNLRGQYFSVLQIALAIFAFMIQEKGRWHIIVMCHVSVVVVMIARMPCAKNSPISKPPTFCWQWFYSWHEQNYSCRFARHSNALSTSDAGLVVGELNVPNVVHFISSNIKTYVYLSNSRRFSSYIHMIAMG